jgi:hypothetical protein
MRASRAIAVARWDARRSRRAVSRDAQKRVGWDRQSRNQHRCDSNYRAPRASGEHSGETMDERRDVVVFAYDAIVDATLEMTRVSHAVARARWPDNVPGEAASYEAAMRTMRRCLGESTSCEAVVMMRVIADEAIIGGRTTSGGRPGPVFSFEQRFERRTRPLTVDEIIASWPEIKLMSVMKWGEDLETSIGWDGRRMTPMGLQADVDAERNAREAQAGEQVVYEDLKPLLLAALDRGSHVYVLASRGRSVESCAGVLRENGLKVWDEDEDDDTGCGIRVVSTDTYASRGLAAAHVIATNSNPGERWYIVDGDIDELERFREADLGEAYDALTLGVDVSLQHAGYAYASPRQVQRASLDPHIELLTDASARNLAINFFGTYAR